MMTEAVADDDREEEEEEEEEEDGQDREPYGLARTPLRDTDADEGEEEDEQKEDEQEQEHEEPWVVADGAAELAGDAPGPRRSRVTQDSGAARHEEETHRRWADIQSSFVDDPHGSVAQAAAFAAKAIDTLVTSIKQRERELRGEWDHEGADTEGLRNTLRNYRSLLERIAAMSSP
jgi:hypothetical protein